MKQFPLDMLDIEWYELEDTRKGETMKRLSDYGTIDPDAVGFRLSDVENEEVVITDCDFRNGEFGEYAVMHCTWGEDNEGVIITGAYLVVDALKDASKNKAFPLTAMFTRRGRTWMIS